MKFLAPRNANLTLNLIKNKTNFQYFSIFSGFFEVFVVHFVQMRILGLCCCQMEEPNQYPNGAPLDLRGTTQAIEVGLNCARG